MVLPRGREYESRVWGLESRGYTAHLRIGKSIRTEHDVGGIACARLACESVDQECSARREVFHERGAGARVAESGY
jgi:hypothetical protein